MYTHRAMLGVRIAAAGDIHSINACLLCGQGQPNDAATSKRSFRFSGSFFP